jgi:ATP-binding cassette, subfamily B, bacterial MsbA
MKKYWNILKLLLNYKSYSVLTIIFNLLSTVFSLFSFLMIIPFLEILFSTTPLVTERPDFALSVKAMTQLFNFEVSQLISTKGPEMALIFICLLVLFNTFFKNLFRYAADYYMTYAKNAVVRDIRNNLFAKIISLPLSFYSGEKKGEILTRISVDVQEIESSILNTFKVILKEPITVILFLATLFVMSAQLTLIILVLLPLSGFIIGRISRRLKSIALKGQGILSGLLSMVEESLSGLRIIKAFNGEEKINKHFRDENYNYFKTFNKLIRLRDLASPLTEFMSMTVIVFVLYMGSKSVLANQMEAGVFIGFLAIFSQLINPAKAFSTAIYQIQKGMASIERINEVMDSELKIIEKSNAIGITGFDGEIKYENVCFSYDKTEVLHDINFTLKKGKMLALVGQSGSGKSTLADLLPRFYDVSKGKITIDGNDIRDVKLKDLRKLMGIVSQESVLFNDTIFYNIAFGKPNATMDEVMEAAKVANAHDFINAFPDGYNTIVGDRGSSLSGGERQRVTIARAVLANPPILILDEATSSLDSQSEKQVQEALFNLMKNRTSLIIAHRLSTIQYADEILVVHNGKIVERGNHNSLMINNGIYKSLVDMQAF